MHLTNKNIAELAYRASKVNTAQAQEIVNVAISFHNSKKLYEKCTATLGNLTTSQANVTHFLCYEKALRDFDKLFAKWDVKKATLAEQTCFFRLTNIRNEVYGSGYTAGRELFERHYGTCNTKNVVGKFYEVWRSRVDAIRITAGFIN